MKSTLENFIEDGIVYDNIIYKDTDFTVELKNGKKPIDSWMRHWTLDQRLEKFFEFCHAFDRREDELLAKDYQIFSHRLHWHEHPFCDLMRSKTSLRDILWYTLVFSFSNEHWGTLTHLIDRGVESTREKFSRERHARNDLFQIYYPKNTNVKEWLLTGPLKAAEAMCDKLENRETPYSMMQFAKLLEKHFKEEQGFRSPLYPCKNAARYLAMSFPHLVDPESVLYGGTGHFDGLHQIFGGKNINGKAQYSIDGDGQFVPENDVCRLWLEQMKILCEDSRNPMKSQRMLNVEDKTCFMFKHIAITHGVKSPTKRIPYNWIFPNDFNLAKHPQGRVVLDGKGYRQLQK